MATVLPLLCFAIVVLVVAAVIRSMRKGPRSNADINLPYPVINASKEEIQRRQMECRDRLGDQVFGAELARSLWKSLQRCPQGAGLIHQYHRDYCGHGLIREPEGISLREVQDGGSYFGPPLATWETEEDFVHFFARQSDFSCSGWDAREPVFHTNDEWNRNNQRLTAVIIRKFIKDGSEPRLS